MIELPAFERLREARSVLLLGAGGGYDILGAVPLFAALRALGKIVHLGGISFTSLEALPDCQSDEKHACLFAVRGPSAVSDRYCPEPWLARWLEKSGHDQPIWAFAKVGVRPLRAALADLVERLGADAVVLVDGGVDILLRGDETSIGTPAEDLTSLCAVSGLDVPTRLIMCLGFGAEPQDEDARVSSGRIRPNVAEPLVAGDEEPALLLYGRPECWVLPPPHSLLQDSGGVVPRLSEPRRHGGR